MIQRNPEAETAIKTEVKEARDFEILKTNIENNYKIQLKKLEIEAAKKEAAKLDRQHVFERLAIAIIKLPIMIPVILVAGILWLRDRELPSELEDFINL